MLACLDWSSITWCCTSTCIFKFGSAMFLSYMTTSWSNSLTGCSGNCLGSFKGTRDWWTGIWFWSCCCWLALSYPPTCNCSGGLPRLRNGFWNITEFKSHTDKQTNRISSTPNLHKQTTSEEITPQIFKRGFPKCHVVARQTLQMTFVFGC